MFLSKKLLAATLILVISSLPSCTCSPKNTIKIDGSSTVYVISEAVAEEFKKIASGSVSIGISGTGGGFKKLCSNRVNIIGASRTITATEKDLCRQNAVQYYELPVAYDGIVVVVNKENTWINEITVSTLKKIFEPAAEGTVLLWSDIDPSWPKRKFEIFAPGISSGTYDYFTKAIVGIEHSSRGDITSSEDDNVLVHGISSTKDSLGFFSFAYFSENKNELKALPIINDVDQNVPKAISATVETIRNHSYQPLSRPVFVYANRNLDQLSRNFLRFYLENSQEIASDVGFIPLNDDEYKHALKVLQGDDG